MDATVPPAPAAAAPPAPAPSNNAPLALGAVAAAVVLFAVTRLGGSAPTLATLEQMSTPLDVALVNGRPSVVEFYANWYVIESAPCKSPGFGLGGAQTKRTGAVQALAVPAARWLVTQARAPWLPHWGLYHNPQPDSLTLLGRAGPLTQV